MKYLLILLLLTNCEATEVHKEVQDEVHTEVQELETELKEAREYIKHLEDEISILESYLAQTL